MDVKTLFKNKKAVSSVIGAVIMIGVTIAAVSIVYGVLGTTMSFDSSITPAGAIIAEDVDQDGLVDRMTVPMVNKGMSNADIKSVQVKQGDKTYLWYTMDNSIRTSTTEAINIYALGELQQIQPVEVFNIEIIFEEGTYTSPGYVVIDSDSVPEQIIPIIIDEVPVTEDPVDPEDPVEEETNQFVGFNLLVERTAADDEYAGKKFPTDVGYSPNLWFILGEFDDNNKRPNLNTDFIAECGFGAEEDYQPYLLDNDEFTEGRIGSQSNNKITPYNDSGEHAGLISFNKYGKWDKQDNLNWGKYGVAYMWSYIYVPGDDDVSVGFSANGATEYQVFVNGEYTLSGTKKDRWYTDNDVILNAGLNLVMMKISAKTDAHFAGQVLFFENANTNVDLGTLYNVWPTLGDL